MDAYELGVLVRQTIIGAIGPVGHYLILAVVILVLTVIAFVALVGGLALVVRIINVLYRAGEKRRAKRKIQQAELKARQVEAERKARAQAIKQRTMQSYQAPTTQGFSPSGKGADIFVYVIVALVVFSVFFGVMALSFALLGPIGGAIVTCTLAYTIKYIVEEYA